MNPPVLKNCASFAKIAVSLTMLVGCVSPRLGRSKLAAPLAARPSDKPAPSAAELSYPQTRPLDEKKPVKIKSDHLRYNDKLKETEFRGNVVATQDSATLRADRMRSSTQGQAASASGHLQLTDPSRKIELLANEGDYSQALSEANLRGDVILHSVDPYAVPLTVTGQSGWYHSVSRRARLEGEVTLLRSGLTATAEKVSMDGAADLIELSGNVAVRMGGNRVTSQRATLNGVKKSVLFSGDVEAALIPAQIRERASHPEKP